ncbi:MAG: EpsI family protein [Phycisphaerae bacterium]|nr:EpsI family protein [Phycisphaerae bacterium]
MNSKWVKIGVWVLVAAAVVAAFWEAFAAMWLRWFPAWNNERLGLYDRLVEGESYYTHGPLVPMVSVIIAWLLIRHTRLEARPCPRWGWPAVAAALLLHLLGVLARVSFVSVIAFVGLVAAVVLLLWGPRVLGRLWFAIAFLLFMIPLPEVTIANLNFRLKMIAADWGVTLASWLGIAVERDGPMVVLAGGKSLVVANVCNGLRTLISLLAFGALYAYICRLRGAWRVGLFLAAVPMAVVCNAVRIASLIVVAQVWDTRAATGWWHDTSGLLIFVLAFWLMFAAERLILAARHLVGRPARIEPLFADVRRDVSRDAGILPACPEGVSPSSGCGTDSTFSADQPHGTHNAGGTPASREMPPNWPALARLAAGRVTAAVLAVMMLTAAGAWWLGRPDFAAANNDLLAAALPARLDVAGTAWHGEPHQLSERELIILEGPSYVYRRYRDDEGGEVDYCFLYSRDNRKGIHPPDLCVEGLGQGITRKGEFDVVGVLGHDRVPCRELVAQSELGWVYMLYTYKSGRGYTRSFWRQQGGIFLDGLLRRNLGGGMIRISLPCGDDNNIDAARRQAEEFLRITIPDLDRTLAGDRL